MMTNYDNQENEHLKKLMESATANVDSSEDKSIRSKSTIKIILITLIVMVAFATILYFAASKINKPQEFEDTTEDPSWVSKREEQAQAEEETSQWDFEYPVDVPKWSKQEFSLTLIEDEEVYNELINYALSVPDMVSATAWMPSSEEGDWEGAPPVFTSDPSEEYLEDGSQNPHYSYTLKEDYLLAYSVYVQRLINPTFGKWIFAQHYTPSRPLKDKEDFNVLSDMFSDDWWETNISEGEDYSALPIVVDWEGDDFGGLELAEPKPGRYGTFFGQIDESEEENRFTQVNNIGVDNNNSPILEVNTPIKYVAFGIDDKPIEKKGNLVLTLSSNDKLHEIFRVVISDAKLLLD